MKKKLKSIGICILLFIVTLIFSFVFFLTLSNVFVRFSLISSSNSFWISIIGGGVVALGVLIYVIIRRNALKETPFSNWLSLNYHKFILWYIISIIIFGSIKKDVNWTLNDLKDMVALEWSIFAISITIFLVWDALILPRLTEQKPKNSNDMSLLLKVNYIKKKGEFYQKVSWLFNSMSLLVFNLLALILTTGIVYTASESVDVFNQNLVIICLYLCTNALLMLFIDIFKLLKLKKKELLEGMKVTQEDINLENKIVEQMAETLKALNAIDKLTNMKDEEKKKIKNDLLKEIVGTYEQLKEAKEAFLDKK